MDTLAAWKRAVDDPHHHDLPYKVETNEYGQLVLSLTKFYHTGYQSGIHESLIEFLGDRGKC